MAKPDKTDKPEDALIDETPKADEIIDAEIVEETPDDESQLDEVLADENDALTLENPDEDEPEAEANEEEAIEEESAEPEPMSPEPEIAVVEEDKRNGGFMPLFVGGVVAAGIGFGAASYLGSQGILFGAKSDEAIAQLTRQLEEQQDVIRLLQSNQEKISTTANDARDGLSGVEDANARTAALSERVDAMGGKIQTLEGRVLETEKRPMSEGASSVAIEAYEREVEQLRAMVAEQLAEAESLKEASSRTAQETLARAALTRVVSAVESGAPYRAALTELASVSGVAIPEGLSNYADEGVPTNMALVDSFPEYARAALADARKHESKDGNRVTQFLKNQLQVRSTEPKEGADADAILSRAEAALREGRLAASLDELAALPESSQGLMADWRAMAESHLNATEAVETLAQSLNSN